jgi:DNA-binding NarL/FixJ family response regulator
MEDQTKKITLLLVEDDGPVIWAVKDAVAEDQDLHYLGCIMGRSHLEQFVSEHAPDLVLVDLKLPVAGSPNIFLSPEYKFEEGLWAIKRVKQLSPQSRIIAFSNFFLDNPKLAQRALEQGADAVLPKQYAPSDEQNWGQWLRHQLHSVAHGFWRPDAVMAHLLLTTEENVTQDGVDHLSHRELEVLRLLSKSLTDDEIAEALVIEPTTVRSHIRNIMGKLHARTRRDAVSQARRSGLMDDSRDIESDPTY